MKYLKKYNKSKKIIIEIDNYKHLRKGIYKNKSDYINLKEKNNWSFNILNNIFSNIQYYWKKSLNVFKKFSVYSLFFKSNINLKYYKYIYIFIIISLKKLDIHIIYI